MDYPKLEQPFILLLEHWAVEPTTNSPREKGNAIDKFAKRWFSHPTEFRFASVDGKELTPICGDIHFHEIKSYSNQTVTISHDCYHHAQMAFRAGKDTLFWFFKHGDDANGFTFEGFIRFSTMREESIIGGSQYDSRTLTEQNLLAHRAATIQDLTSATTL